MKTGEPKDNSSEPLKAHMRKKWLPVEAHVLDLFCGKGAMWERVYKERATTYLGLDNIKIHDQKICRLVDNRMYVTRNSIDRHNVFDLDDYGCPWKLLHLILRKRCADDITIYLTDGLPLKLKASGEVAKIVSAVEQIPRGMEIPGQYRFYLDMFGTMLWDIENRYGWQTSEAHYARNTGGAVYYWALKMTKKPA